MTGPWAGANSGWRLGWVTVASAVARFPAPVTEGCTVGAHQLVSSCDNTPEVREQDAAGSPKAIQHAGWARSLHLGFS